MFVHTGFWEAEMVIAGEAIAMTDCFSPLEVFGFPVGQAIDEVTTHLMESLFAGTYTSVSLLYPAGLLFTYQLYIGLVPPLTTLAV